MKQPTREELHEEALLFLRMVERDVEAFQVLKQAPTVHISRVCFFAQQAVEKSLKAVLILNGVELRKTHDLEKLVALLLDINITPPYTSETFGRLNPYAVTLRYDDTEIERISRADIEEIVNTTQRWAIEWVG